MLLVPFGWLPERQSSKGQWFTINPLADLDERVDTVLNSGRVWGRWYYPPLEDRHGVSLSARGPRPKVYAQAFELPGTHQLNLEGHPQETWDVAPFLILVFGFLKGLKLLPEGWQHFYRVAVDLGALGDLQPPGPPLVEQLLESALELRRRCAAVHSEKRLFGAWHWHLFGQSYEHPFEYFSAQYTVLDSLWRIHCDLYPVKQQLPHACRPVELASHYGLHVPAWARLDGKNESPLSRLRNAFFHEGLFGAEPTSFGHPRNYENIDYELALFNARLFFALMGLQDPYVSTPVDAGKRYRLRGDK